MLRNGNIILGGVNSESYDLIIPGYDNKHLHDLYEGANQFARNSNGQERVDKFLQYVNQEIDYNEKWREMWNYEMRSNEPIGRLTTLDKSLTIRQGVCKESAAILDMLLRMDGFTTEYKRGAFTTSSGKTGKHAWLKVYLDRKEYLADPTNNIFGPYDSVSKHWSYKECYNPIGKLPGMN